MSNDLWRTPPEVIDYIEKRFSKIQLDLCASDDGHVCDSYLTKGDDFLKDCWLAYCGEEFNLHTGDLCWINPPYSNPMPFVKQAVTWSIHGYAVAGILNLDPSTKWFIELQMNAAVIMPIIGGRVAFLDDNGNPINGNNKPQFMFYLAPFGSVNQSTDYVHIDEIYPNGKHKKVKHAR